MNRRILPAASFSLVEITLAIGIAGLCLITVFGLLPIGTKINQAAFSQTAAASVLSNVVADMRAAGTNASSPQYNIVFGARTDLYFDANGKFAANPQSNSRYRVVITFPTASAFATCANVKISWPTAVDPTTATALPAGIIETVAAFDRN